MSEIVKLGRDDFVSLEQTFIHENGETYRAVIGERSEDGVVCHNCAFDSDKEGCHNGPDCIEVEAMIFVKVGR